MLTIRSLFFTSTSSSTNTSTEMTSFSVQGSIIPPILCNPSTQSNTGVKKNITKLQINQPIQNTLFITDQIKNFVDSIPTDLLDGWHNLTTSEGEYSGPIEKGKPKGKGTITVPFGTYEGELDGLPHGKGFLTTFMSTLKGSFVNGQCHGTVQGSFLELQEISKKIKNGFIDSSDFTTLSLRERFEGEYKEGKCDGKGTYYFVNGSFYQGDFINGVIQGNGLYIYPNDETYEGEWIDGQFSGEGTYTEANGDGYKGEWLDNQRHGTGILFKRNGEKETVTYNNGQLIKE